MRSYFLKFLNQRSYWSECAKRTLLRLVPRECDCGCAEVWRAKQFGAEAVRPISPPRSPVPKVARGLEMYSTQTISITSGSIIAFCLAKEAFSDEPSLFGGIRLLNINSSQTTRHKKVLSWENWYSVQFWFQKQISCQFLHTILHTAAHNLKGEYKRLGELRPPRPVGLTSLSVKHENTKVTVCWLHVVHLAEFDGHADFVPPVEQKHAPLIIRVIFPWAAYDAGRAGQYLVVIDQSVVAQ